MNHAVQPTTASAPRWWLVALGTLLAVPGVRMGLRFLDEAGEISRGTADPVGRFWAFAYFVVVSVVLTLAVAALLGGSWRAGFASRTVARCGSAFVAAVLLMCWAIGLDAYLGTDLLRR